MNDQSLQKTDNLYKDCIAAGLETGNHESDLHIKDCPEARELLKLWGYEHPRVFVSKTDRTLWLDIPFMYSPYWKKTQ